MSVMRTRKTLLICWLSAAWFAAWVAWATQRLNADQLWSHADRVFLLLDLGLLYGGLLTLYALAAGWVDAVSRYAVQCVSAQRINKPWANKPWIHHSADTLRHVLTWTPLVYSLFLPQIVPSPAVWSRWTQELPSVWRLAGAGLLAALLTFLWNRLGAPGASSHIDQETPKPPRRFSSRVAWSALAALPLIPIALLWLQAPTQTDSDYLLSPLPAPPVEAPPPPPLVLLVIDGADLDDMILPMVEAGELPALARLMQQGTWGHLKSLKPTLSPVLWTSLATGKPMRDHGIKDFVFYHLPGVRPAIHRFPQGSGLNHRLFPHLEAQPIGFERPPYSTVQRRARTLWDIIGERYRVGIYRWLVTWPAEPVNGFLVSGGVYAGPGDWNPKAKSWLQRMRRLEDDPLESLSQFPPGVLSGIEPFEIQPPTDDMLRTYAPEAPFNRRHKHFRLVARSLVEPTAWELTRLMEDHSPHFVAASFYSVDSFQHRFGKFEKTAGPWAHAIAERYRESDRQLAALLEVLPAEGHLLVISDHGYDFEVDHHWEAPAGVFFGRGPAFEAGRRHDDLGLLDIAPLALHLLGFPMPDDMPGAKDGRFLQALAPPWRQVEDRLLTYERPPSERPTADLPASLSDAMKDELRSLGYIQ